METTLLDYETAREAREDRYDGSQAMLPPLERLPELPLHERAPMAEALPLERAALPVERAASAPKPESELFNACSLVYPLILLGMLGIGVLNFLLLLGVAVYMSLGGGPV